MNNTITISGMVNDEKKVFDITIEDRCVTHKINSDGYFEAQPREKKRFETLSDSLVEYLKTSTVPTDMLIDILKDVVMINNTATTSSQYKLDIAVA